MKRSLRWWQVVEQEAADPAVAPEPWADRSAFAPTLTEDQQAVLAGLEDQPAGPRLDGLDDDSRPDQPPTPRVRAGNRTGNPPGDTGPTHPYRPNAWKEVDQ